MAKRKNHSVLWAKLTAIARRFSWDIKDGNLSNSRGDAPDRVKIAGDRVKIYGPGERLLASFPASDPEGLARYLQDRYFAIEVELEIPVNATLGNLTLEIDRIEGWLARAEVAGTESIGSLAEKYFHLWQARSARDALADQLYPIDPKTSAMTDEELLRDLGVDLADNMETKPINDSDPVDDLIVMQKGAIASEKLEVLLAGLSTAKLCDAWESMDMGKNCTNREELAIGREFILKELEKRDPAAMTAWDESDDPHLSNRPSAFFLSHVDPPNSITDEKPIAVSKLPSWGIQSDIWGRPDAIVGEPVKNKRSGSARDMEQISLF